MSITLIKPKEVKKFFMELNDGDMFMLEDVVYMKIPLVQDCNDDNTVYNVVIIENMNINGKHDRGLPKYIEGIEIITPVDITAGLIIETKGEI